MTCTTSRALNHKLNHVLDRLFDRKGNNVSDVNLKDNVVCWVAFHLDQLLNLSNHRFRLLARRNLFKRVAVLGPPLFQAAQLIHRPRGACEHGYLKLVRVLNPRAGTCWIIFAKALEILLERCRRFLEPNRRAP